MTFRLEYEVGDAGWATCRVAFGEKAVDMTVSYLHDSLDQLCDAVASVALGAKTATVVFMNEPGEHHLNLTRAGESDVVVQIVWHDDWPSWGMGDASKGRVVLQETAPISELRGRTCATVRAILDALGPAGYKRRWVEHDFPAASFKRLEEA